MGPIRQLRNETCFGLTLRRVQFINHWKNDGMGLQDALAAAFAEAAPLSPWVQIMGPKLVFRGYAKLHFDECNQDDMNMPQPYD